MDKLPSNWEQLFQHNRINLLQDEPTIDASLKLDPEWDTVYDMDR
jgi:uncharacterized protein (DUF2132 family)